MEKAYIQTRNLKPDELDFIWYKDKEWCIGKIIGEGVEGKSRVDVEGQIYETHTNCLQIPITDSNLKVRRKCWLSLIKRDLIHTNKVVNVVEKLNLVTIL